jgi:hypothetical protein
MKVDEAFNELCGFQTGEMDEKVLLHPPSILFLISTFTSLVSQIIYSEQSGESTWSLANSSWPRAAFPITSSD